MVRQTRAEIYGGVKDVLVDILGVGPEEVIDDASIGSGLGAESLDELEIIFRLERDFELKLPTGEAFLRAWDGPDKSRYIFGNTFKYKPAGVQYLRETYPTIDLDGFEGDPLHDQILDRFTVGSLVDYIEMKAGQQDG